MKIALLASCLAGTATLAKADYTGGQLNNYNGTYTGTIRVTTTNTSAILLTSAAATTTLNGDILIATSGGANSHGMLINAGTAVLTGKMDIQINSVAGSGLRVMGTSGVASLDAGSSGPIKISILDTSSLGTIPEEAAGIYNNNGKVSVKGDLILEAHQARGYGLWSISTVADGTYIDGNVAITTYGDQGFGIRNDRGNVTITGTTDIVTTQGAAAGIRAESGNLTFGSNLRISTVGSSQVVGTTLMRYESGYGIWNTAASGLPTGVVPTGAHIVVNGATDITTAGNAAFGVYNDTPQGVIDFNGPVSIKTSGGEDRYTYYTLVLLGVYFNSNELAGAYGVNSSSGTTNFNGPTTIAATGNKAGGVRATGGTVNFADTVDIATEQTEGHGVNLLNNSSNRTGTVNFNGVSTITVNGANANGVNISKGTANFNAPSTITANGAGGYGVRVSGGSAVFKAPPTISSATTDVVNVSGGSALFNTGGTIPGTAAGAYAIHTLATGLVQGAGLFNITGDLRAEAKSKLDLSMTGASQLVGMTTHDTGTATLNLKLADSSQWTVTASSDLTNLANGGLIAYTPPVGGAYKTVTTDYYVGNNGTIGLNTYLGADSSPSDLLLINGGTATGSSLLRVANTTGGGALTEGDGIMVVQAINGASTNGDAFALSGRVAAGGYDYLLYYGGNTLTGGDPNDQNWYLRSKVAALIPDNPDDPILPHDPDSPVPPGYTPADVPNVSPEVPVVSALMPLATEYGYSMLGTMHERTGEGYAPQPSPVSEDRTVWCKDPSKKFRCTVRVPVGETARDTSHWFNGAWARLIGDRGFHERNSFLRRGPDYDYRFWGVQAGFDVYGRERADGTLDTAGLYAAYGQISADVDGAYFGPAGTVDMDAYTLGGYWTHKSAQGWYTDAVVQGTWYSTDAKSIEGEKMKPDGFGIVGSLEGGYAFRLGNGYALEPQAQAVYQNVSFERTHDSYAQYWFRDGDSLRGRLGVRLAKTWDTGSETKSRLITGWLRGNVWHEFMADDKTVVGGLSCGSDCQTHSILASLGGTWGEVGAGVTGQVSDTMALFATGAYQRSLDNKGREAWTARLGASAKW